MDNQIKDPEGEAKLGLLREADPVRTWRSLDDTRHCILCENTISARQIRVTRDRHNLPQLHCPTRGCKATPSEWVHPEDPLTSEAAWRDWLRLFDAVSEENVGPMGRRRVR